MVTRARGRRANTTRSKTLNIPADHPARDNMDTFYLPARLAVATAHVADASPHDARASAAGRRARARQGLSARRARRAAIRSCSTRSRGCTSIAASRSATSKVSRPILCRHLFGANRRTRFRPSYFQFTEPSAEVDVSCRVCDGAGCRTCKGSGWLEMGGSGMVHPNVLAGAGYDPEESTPAGRSGLGIDRIAMLRHGIDDIRVFFENDPASWSSSASMRLSRFVARDFVETDATPQAIADALTARGFTVDAHRRRSRCRAKIVVGRDRDAGAAPRTPTAASEHGGRRGASSCRSSPARRTSRSGDKVPIALVGAVVYARGGARRRMAPETKRDRTKSTLRGVESNGMMCSRDRARVAGRVSTTASSSWTPTAPVGEDFWRAIRFGDAVLDVDVPSNRPDCLSVIGLAREAAAGLGAPLQLPQLARMSGATPSPIAVEIGDPAVCRRLRRPVLHRRSGSRRTPLVDGAALAGSARCAASTCSSTSRTTCSSRPASRCTSTTPRRSAVAASSRGRRAHGESVVTLDGVRAHACGRHAGDRRRRGPRRHRGHLRRCAIRRDRVDDRRLRRVAELRRRSHSAGFARARLANRRRAAPRKKSAARTA